MTHGQGENQEYNNNFKVWRKFFVQSHASSETVFDDLELFCSFCHWLRRISQIEKNGHKFLPPGGSLRLKL